MTVADAAMRAQRPGCQGARSRRQDIDRRPEGGRDLARRPRPHRPTTARGRRPTSRLAPRPPDARRGAAAGQAGPPRAAELVVASGARSTPRLRRLGRPATPGGTRCPTRTGRRRPARDRRCAPGRSSPAAGSSQLRLLLRRAGSRSAQLSRRSSSAARPSASQSRSPTNG